MMSALVGFAEHVAARCRAQPTGSGAFRIRQLYAHCLWRSTMPLTQQGSDSTMTRWLSTRAGSSMLLVHPRDRSPQDLQEAHRLAETFAGSPVQHFLVGRQKPARTASLFLGKGTVEDVAASCQDSPPSRIFVNAALSAVQQRNLQAAWGIPVVDRTGLIIDIFAQRALSREANLQVQLASLDLQASRLVRTTTASGRGTFGDASEVVSARERGRSGSGTGGLGGGGGGGETELALQRSRLRARIKQLKQELQRVRKTRDVQRASRRRAGTPLVAVVGYTNSGKSSLVSALSGSPIEARDRLFETLDTKARRVTLPSGRHCIMSDTVGFISDLPHQLINAFRATLEEVLQADVLLHVLDAANPAVQDQHRTVIGVLKQLGLSSQMLQDRVVEVWNKVDLLHQTQASHGLVMKLESEQARASENPGTASSEGSEDDNGAEPLPVAMRPIPVNAVPLSVLEGVGMQDLLQTLDNKLAAKQPSP